MAKFEGFLFFVVMMMAGFWGAFYFAAIMPYWISGWFKMKNQEKKAEKRGETLDYHTRPTLPEQEGVTVLYQRK